MLLHTVLVLALSQAAAKGPRPRQPKAPPPPPPPVSAPAVPKAAAPASNEALPPAVDATPDDDAPAPTPGTPGTPGTSRAAGPVAKGSSRMWRVATLDVPGVSGPVKEVRVLRGDDSALTVGEGLTDIGEGARLNARAATAAKEETWLLSLAGRVAFLAVGGVVTLLGVAGAVAGGGFTAMSLGGTSSMAEPMRTLADQGPSMVMAGVVVAFLGLITVAATGALWVWLIFLPTPPDASKVGDLASSLAWDASEAAEVVARHNEGVAQDARDKR